MIIGIDFDNTIANYTGVFHRVAVTLDWMPESIGKSKAEVKKYFVDSDNEERWTELQGKVYGSFINEAEAYSGVLNFIKHAKQQGHSVYIISHKTKYPYIGEKVDFHKAANNWLQNKGFFEVIKQTECFFNETKEQKINKIASLDCDIFFDDLISILQHELFPASCMPVLYGIDDVESVDIKVLDDWANAIDLIDE